MIMCHPFAHSHSSFGHGRFAAGRELVGIGMQTGELAAFTRGDIGAVLLDIRFAGFLHFFALIFHLLLHFGPVVLAGLGEFGFMLLHTVHHPAIAWFNVRAEFLGVVFAGTFCMGRCRLGKSRQT